jgi:hypothetical protein
MDADVVVFAGGDRLEFSKVRATIRAGRVIYDDR